MADFDEIFDRIKSATNTRTQVELANVLDIRQSSISDAKRRNSVPADWVMKLFDQFGLSPDWLKKGVGPMYLRTEQGYIPAQGPAQTLCEEPGRYSGADAKNSVVSVFSTQALPDGEEDSAPVCGRLNIPQSFATPGLHVVQVETAGMTPHILKGAFVGIDTEQRRVVSGEIYGIRIPYEGLVFKRAFIDTQSNRLILRSENPAHPEISLPLDNHDAHILGRVVWVLQRM